MYYLFIDTNIWLSLFHLSENDWEQFSTLENVLSDEIKLLIPKQVVDEFYRNRDSKIADALSKFKLIKLQTPNIIKQHEEYDELYNLQKEFSRKFEKIKDSVIQDIKDRNTKADKLISKFFESATEVPEESVLKARLRYIKGNPPGKNNSYGDAINWEFLLKEVPDDTPLFIITDDKDYYSKLTNKDEINLFLKEEWKAKKNSEVLIFPSLKSFFDQHLKKIKLIDENKKEELIDALEQSGAFAITHLVIAELEKYTDWNDEQIQRLCQICKENSQIYLIIEDGDVSNFYSNLLTGYSGDNEFVKYVRKKLHLPIEEVTSSHSDIEIKSFIDIDPFDQL